MHNSGEIRKLQTSKSANKVDVWKKYLHKYKQQCTVDLLFCILKEGDEAELLEWPTLTLITNFC